ncbi:MAG: hypothetical protein IJI43_01045 [Bacilli bacterium]|nr:hypothetical protein [Bacilli bacterium]
MEEKKKSNIGIILLVIVLLCAAFAGGYFVNEKGLIGGEKDTPKEEEKEEKETTKELDVNSRLVKMLYNETIMPELSDSCHKQYETWSEGTEKKDFVAESAMEEIKMRFVAHNLSEDFIKHGGKAPASPLENYKNSDQDSYYEKSYIDSVYKQIFGVNSKLDTSATMYKDRAHFNAYIYDSKTDNYYLYNIIVGDAICGPAEEKLTLSKAVEKGDIVELTVNAEWFAENVSEEKYKYIYTFEKDKDELYKFVSVKVE